MTDQTFKVTPVSNPGEVSARAMRFVDAVRAGLARSVETDFPATLAASATCHALFSVIKFYGLTEDQARTATSAALQTLSEGGYFDRKEGGANG